MSSITIRKLDDGVKRRLRIRAAQRNHEPYQLPFEVVGDVTMLGVRRGTRRRENHDEANGDQRGDRSEEPHVQRRRNVRTQAVLALLASIGSKRRSIMHPPVPFATRLPR